MTPSCPHLQHRSSKLKSSVWISKRTLVANPKSFISPPGGHVWYHRMFLRKPKNRQRPWIQSQTLLVCWPRKLRCISWTFEKPAIHLSAWKRVVLSANMSRFFLFLNRVFISPLMKWAEAKIFSWELLSDPGFDRRKSTGNERRPEWHAKKSSDEGQGLAPPVLNTWVSAEWPDSEKKKKKKKTIDILNIQKRQSDGSYCHLAAIADTMWSEDSFGWR